MRHIDWPLAVTLAFVFIVMSVVRWRYFRSLARRRARRSVAATQPPAGDPPPSPDAPTE